MLVSEDLRMHPADTVATWWSFAEADETLMGVVVVVLSIAAIAYVATRVIGRRRR